MRFRPPPVASWILVVCIAACDAETDSPGAAALTDVGPVVRDSAGIQIVESSGAPPATWALATEPDLRIGAAEGDPAHQLHMVRAARRLSDGTLVIADGGSQELRFFDGGGEFLHAAGGRGAGPGEFEDLRGLARTRGDTLIAFDRRLLRVSVVSPDAQHVEDASVRAISEARVLPTFYGSLDGGTVLVSTTLRTRAAPTGYKRDTLDVRVLHPADGTTAEVGRFPSSELFGQVTSSSGDMVMVEEGSLPFARRTYAAARGGEVFVGSSDRYEVYSYASDGSLQRIVRRLDRPPTELTTALIDEWIRRSAERVEEARGEPVPEYRASLREMPHGSHLPAWSDLIVDATGALWVADFRLPWERDQPRRWSVFDGEGRVAAELEVPSELDILDIGADFLLVRTRDELGVERVQLHRLDRGG